MSSPSLYVIPTNMRSHNSSAYDVQTNTSSPNTVAPPYARLPPEVWNRIFLYMSKTFSEVVGFSSVCRRWRAIALDSPLLWGHVSGCPSKAVLEYQLTRSQNTPLVVFLDIPQSHPTESTEPIISTVLSQLHRIKHLSIYAPSYCLELFQRFGAMPLLAPALETLDLKLIPPDPPYVDISPIAFQWQIPNLVVLRIAQISLSADSQLISASLQELSLIGSYYFTSEWGIAEWRDLLPSLTSLRVLRTHQAFCFDYFTDSDYGGAIELSNLHSIYLYESLVGVTLFLTHCVVPSTANTVVIVLQDVNENFTYDEVVALVEVLRPFVALRFSSPSYDRFMTISEADRRYSVQLHLEGANKYVSPQLCFEVETSCVIDLMPLYALQSPSVLVFQNIIMTDEQVHKAITACSSITTIMLRFLDHRTILIITPILRAIELLQSNQNKSQLTSKLKLVFDSTIFDNQMVQKLLAQLNQEFLPFSKIQIMRCLGITHKHVKEIHEQHHGPLVEVVMTI